MGVSWEHYHALYPVSAHFIFDDFVCSFLAHLNQTVSADHDELFPFGVVPVLAFSNAWLADIYADLAAVEGMHQFSERTPLVYIHLQIEDGFLFRKVAQICAQKPFGKAV